MDEKAKKFWFTEAVIVAGTPFIAYFFAFIFEAGRADYFHMPLEFINIGFPQILIFILGFWFAVAILIMLVDYISILFPSGLILMRRFVPVVPGIIVLVEYLIKRDWLGFFLIFLIIILLIGPQFIFSIFFKKGEGTFFQKLEEWDRTEYDFKKNRNAFSISLANALGRENTMIVFSLIFFGLIIHECGHFYAVRESAFLIPSNDSKQVVVGLYGDNAVCAELNMQTNTIKPVFTVYKVSSGMSFQSEEIGPLKVESLKIQ